MGWFVAFILSLVLLMLALQHRRFLRHWRQLERILNDLVAAREPKSFVFLESARFTRLARVLEELADSQERLRRRRSRQEMNLQTILGSMEEGVMVVDRQHMIRLVNPPLLKLFHLGFDPLGQTVLQSLRGAAFDEIVSAAIASWQPQAKEIALDHGKTPRYLAVNAMPMRNASGEEGVVTIFRDITRLKQLEDMRREFVANVSHELRTPLSIFRGYLENLRDNPNLPRSELVETIGVLEKHSFRLNALVEDLLILARLESRDLRLQLEELEVDSFLREIVGDWKLRSARKNIAITLDIAPGLPLLVADALRIEQVMSNLVDNAIKYTPAGGHVYVRATESAGVLELRVEDNGVGVLPVDLPHIFERFYRADKARSREQGGTGLGLSIVKHIVQTHMGTVTAESTFGKGTTIILRFPLRQLEDEEPAAL
ncbi:MAG: hypothetical protein JWL59_1520 [Chthoniobacteraceae bacterium]|nr:hypothetical protein [Chthoniobacteraceae bacterium]